MPLAQFLIPDYQLIACGKFIDGRAAVHRQCHDVAICEGDIYYVSMVSNVIVEEDSSPQVIPFQRHGWACQAPGPVTARAAAPVVFLAIGLQFLLPIFGREDIAMLRRESMRRQNRLPEPRPAQAAFFHFNDIALQPVEFVAEGLATLMPHADFVHNPLACGRQ